MRRYQLSKTKIIFLRICTPNIGKLEIDFISMVKNFTKELGEIRSERAEDMKRSNRVADSNFVTTKYNQT